MAEKKRVSSRPRIKTIRAIRYSRFNFSNPPENPSCNFTSILSQVVVTGSKRAVRHTDALSYPAPTVLKVIAQDIVLGSGFKSYRSPERT